MEGGGEDGEGGDKKREKRRRRRRRRRSKRQLPLCSSFGLMTLHFGWRFELGPFVLLLCYFCVKANVVVVDSNSSTPCSTAEGLGSLRAHLSLVAPASND